MSQIMPMVTNIQTGTMDDRVAQRLHWVLKSIAEIHRGDWVALKYGSCSFITDGPIEIQNTISPEQIQVTESGGVRGFNVQQIINFELAIPKAVLIQQL